MYYNYNYEDSAINKGHNTNSTKVQTLGALRMRDTVMGGPDARGGKWGRVTPASKFAAQKLLALW